MNKKAKAKEKKAEEPKKKEKKEKPKPVQKEKNDVTKVKKKPTGPPKMKIPMKMGGGPKKDPKVEKEEKAVEKED